MKKLALNQMENIQGGLWQPCDEFILQVSGICITRGYDPCRLPGVYCIM